MRKEREKEREREWIVNDKGTKLRNKHEYSLKRNTVEKGDRERKKSKKMILERNQVEREREIMLRKAEGTK